MKYLVVILSLALLVSCRGKKESIYSWKGEEESRKLTLMKNGTFILEINADYFNRTDTGTYRMFGDTLIINPEKRNNEIDSIAFMDSLFNGQYFIEVMETEIVFDTTNTIVESFYRNVIFPNVVVNDSIALSVSPNDPSYKKLIVPDSMEIYNITVAVLEENTCKPVLKYHVVISEPKKTSKSYRLYMPSQRNRENYLGGFKWLLKGDTIESFFSNENCESINIKLVREK